MSSAPPRSPGRATAARSRVQARSATIASPRDFRVDLRDRDRSRKPRQPPADAPLAVTLARARAGGRLRRRDRPAVRRRARHLSAARRPARARRAYRRDRPARSAADGRRVVDARDATVIPGLIDVHAHSSSLVGERLGRAWLAYGVTTVRELATASGEAVERAEAWASGRTPGPRLLVSAANGADVRGAATRRRIRGSRTASRTACGAKRRARGARVGPELVPGPPELALVTAPSRELELSPGFAAYQDGFSQLIAADTTFVTGLAALAGLQRVAEPRDRATTARFAALFTPPSRAAWERPDALAAASCLRLSGRLRGSCAAAAASASAPTRPRCRTVSAFTSSSRCWRGPGIANDQVLRMATAEGALALGPRAADRHPRRGQARRLRRARRRPARPHRRHAAHRRGREGRHLVRARRRCSRRPDVRGLYDAIVKRRSSRRGALKLRALAKQMVIFACSLNTRITQRNRVVGRLYTSTSFSAVTDRVSGYLIVLIDFYVRGMCLALYLPSPPRDE